MTEGDKLNQRVWKVFQKAGFKTKPSDNSSAEHKVKLSARKPRPVDLLAEDKKLKVRIIGSNKSGLHVKPFSGHINDYYELGQKDKAKVLFVVTNRTVTDPDRELIESKKMSLWGRQELEYYEALAATLGQYAKYEILHALKIRTKEERDTHRVLAFRIRQPHDESENELFLFTMTPDRLLKTSVVFRRASNNADAYQRMLQAKRLPKILRFISSAEAILPTDLILHLSERVTVDELDIDLENLRDSRGHHVSLGSTHYDLVVLNIPMEYASPELIDGQHRLFAFTNAEPATKRSFNLVLLGLKGLREKQQQKTFLAINDTAKRVDPNLVAYLKYTKDDVKCQSDPELMAIRVVVDLTEHHPFKDAIRLLDTGRNIITLKGFSGYDLKGLLSRNGLLRKYTPENEPGQYVTALRIYFSAIKELFKDEWDNPKTYIIATNRGISAFLKLLRSVLKMHGAPLDIDDAKKYLQPLQQHWTDWQTTNLKNKYVGSQGWKQFHRDLVAAIANEFPNIEA